MKYRTPTMQEDEQTSRLAGGFSMFHGKHWSAKIQLLIVIVQTIFVQAKYSASILTHQQQMG